MKEDSEVFQQFQHEVLDKIGFWKLHQEDQREALNKMTEVAKQFIEELQQKVTHSAPGASLLVLGRISLF